MFQLRTFFASLGLLTIRVSAIILLSLFACQRCVAQEADLQAEQQSKTGQALIDCGVRVNEGTTVTSFRVPSDGRTRRIVVPWQTLEGLPDLESVSMQARNINQSTIDFFKRCPKLKTVSLFHCSLFLNEESLIWLSEKGMKLSDYCTIHKTELTAAGIKVLNEQRCPDLGFRECSFTQDAIDAIDIEFNGQHLSFAHSKGLTVNDLIDRFGEQANYVNVPWANKLVLRAGQDTWQGRGITWEGDLDVLRDDCLKKIPNLHGITLKARSLRILAALEKCQPNIKLTNIFRNGPNLKNERPKPQSHIEYQDKFFDMVEATPSLDQLHLDHAYDFQEGGRPLRLTTDHRLRFLRIDSLQPFGKELIAEVTKPKFLQGLSVNHSNVLGAEEIRQIIEKSTDLRDAKFNANKLTDEAAALLRSWADEVEYSR